MSDTYHRAVSRADEFLDGYAELERHFRRQLGAENIKSFSVATWWRSLVSQLDDRDGIVAK